MCACKPVRLDEDIAVLLSYILSLDSISKNLELICAGRLSGDQALGLVFCSLFLLLPAWSHSLLSFGFL